MTDIMDWFFPGQKRPVPNHMDRPKMPKGYPPISEPFFIPDSWTTEQCNAWYKKRDAEMAPLYAAYEAREDVKQWRKEEQEYDEWRIGMDAYKEYIKSLKE